MSENSPDLETQVEALTREINELREEINVIRESPYLQSSIKQMVYEVVIDREEVVAREFGQRINEKHGTMYEVKNQAKRMAHLLGLDGDLIRMMVTEAVQNILEHGTGLSVHVRLEINNDDLNPSLVSTFKHDMPPGQTYTLSEINANAAKGDITSDQFDFESDRGRGEYIMKQLTDERRIINGTEINKDGRKVHSFKRMLINYKYPGGPRNKVNFEDIKGEIDRLDYDDVVCCFHVHHRHDRPDAVTIATTRVQMEKVAMIMTQNGFRVTEQEPYYRTVFATFEPTTPVDKERLLGLFARVRQVAYEETEAARAQR